MKFVYIYGPPASGKLTVANELSPITNLKVFHNHLTIDLIKPYFEFGTKSFFELSANLRLNIFESAAKENILGLIFTSCYSYPEDNRTVRKIIQRIEKHGGQCFFVHLFADIDALEKRVIEGSRKNYGKVKSKEDLKKSLSKWEMFTPIPFVESLQIDNTNLSVKEVAAKIISYIEG